MEEESLRMSDSNENEASVKVLIIDDSKTIRRSAENLLTKEGYDVVTASDGFDALAKLPMRDRRSFLSTLSCRAWTATRPVL